MSDVAELASILAALPVGARETGTPELSLAMIPCLGAPFSVRRYPFSEEL